MPRSARTGVIWAIRQSALEHLKVVVAWLTA